MYSYYTTQLATQSRIDELYAVAQKVRDARLSRQQRTKQPLRFFPVWRMFARRTPAM